ncbi:hypothetical protein V8G54_020092, partial [Vigna mungo]
LRSLLLPRRGEYDLTGDREKLRPRLLLQKTQIDIQYLKLIKKNKQVKDISTQCRRGVETKRGLTSTFWDCSYSSSLYDLFPRSGSICSSNPQLCNLWPNDHQCH